MEREQGAYQLTGKIASLAFTFLAGSGITDFAQPLLDRLARESNELVRLAMIDGRELVFRESFAAAAAAEILDSFTNWYECELTTHLSRERPPIDIASSRVLGRGPIGQLRVVE